MNFFYKKIAVIIGFIGLICFIGCNENPNAQYTPAKGETASVGDAVIVHLQAEPLTLNPTNWRDADAPFILDRLYQTLLYRMPEAPYRLTPMLAKSRPVLSADGKALAFTLQDSAQWDDGRPITAEDFAFTLKTLLNPDVECYLTRGYIDFVADISYEKPESKTFTVHLKEKYMLAEALLSEDIRVLPRHIYDSKNFMGIVSVAALVKGPPYESPQIEKDLKQFAEAYNKIGQNPEEISGSGPYKWTKREPKQSIVLTRKTRYWGDAFPQVRSLQAFPQKIVYQVVPDFKAVYAALRSENLDLVRNLPVLEFETAQKDPAVAAHYAFSTPQMFALHFIGFNARPHKNRTPFFHDSKVRQAFTYLIDKKTIFNIVYRRRIKNINRFLQLYETKAIDTTSLFNLAEAEKLLTEAGWRDTDGDGVRDKILNGEKVPFSVEYAYNAGVDNRKNVGLIIKEAAKKIGVEIKINAYDWAVYNEKQREGDYDLFFGGWLTPLYPPDPKPLWHSEAGVNVFGFGAPETDLLIDSIRTDLNEKTRWDKYKKLENKIWQETPCAFIGAPQEALVVHKRFQNAQTFAARPAFELARFWTPQKWVKYR